MRQSLAAAFFEIAVVEGGYQSGDGLWNARVNRMLLSIWNDDDRLVRFDIVERYVAEMRRRYPRYAGVLNDPLIWWNAGNMLHRAIQLELVAEDRGSDGDRGWRLQSRELAWTTVGKGRRRELRQVRGLLPAAQDAQYRREEGIKKRNLTLDRKARGAADQQIANLVRDILRNDPCSTIRPHWVREGWVPSWLAGSRLDTASTIVREAHHVGEMDRRTLKTWLNFLKLDVRVSVSRSRQRAAEQAAGPDHMQVSPDDGAALEVLRR